MQWRDTILNFNLTYCGCPSIQFISVVGIRTISNRVNNGGKDVLTAEDDVWAACPYFVNRNEYGSRVVLKTL